MQNIKKKARRMLPKPLRVVLEASYRYLRGMLLYYGMGMPLIHVRLVGITGTNGKTTSNMFLNSILKAAGFSTALTTTVNTEMLGEYRRNQEHVTSGTTKKLFGFIKEANRQGAEYVVVEVTSQALQQHRHWGLTYDGVGITNLSYEHMEYHKTMDAYAKAKAMILKKGARIAALNVDDEWYDYFNGIEASPNTTKLGFGSLATADVRIKNINLTTKGSAWNVEIDGKDYQLSTPLVGRFNVYNATTAATIAHGLGIPMQAIMEGIAALDWVDGRVNYIDEGQDFAVFTDYAHTPDGLEKVLSTLKEITKGRLILVQSTMDGRDPEKWPKLGEVSGKIADKIFVCDEEAFKLPREVMRNAIIKGIVAAGGKDKYTEIEDRQEAIEAAINAAEKDDTVLIVPFGHITEMTFYDTTIHWDERKVTANAIRKRLGKPIEEIPTEVR